ncbi:unnamed protein product [Ceratitis capitata]|uniref:(Mediterranean fruit fly) hypothetical protein n=1 Tax=Ceratitis capitata TaxID=7213 RepID=A0A811U4H7_CERCA|nr:unnamed protein product [Ceratitis capitata]
MDALMASQAAERRPYVSVYTVVMQAYTRMYVHTKEFDCLTVYLFQSLGIALVGPASTHMSSAANNATARRRNCLASKSNQQLKTTLTVCGQRVTEEVRRLASLGLGKAKGQSAALNIKLKTFLQIPTSSPKTNQADHTESSQQQLPLVVPESTKLFCCLLVVATKLLCYKLLLRPRRRPSSVNYPQIFNSLFYYDVDDSNSNSNGNSNGNGVSTKPLIGDSENENKKDEVQRAQQQALQCTDERTNERDTYKRIYVQIESLQKRRHRACATLSARQPQRQDIQEGNAGKDSGKTLGLKAKAVSRRHSAKRARPLRFQRSKIVTNRRGNQWEIVVLS